MASSLIVWTEGLSLPSSDLCKVSSAAPPMVVLRGKRAVANLQCEQEETEGANVCSGVQAAGRGCP